jgi:hypothetical protein
VNSAGSPLEQSSAPDPDPRDLAVHGRVQHAEHPAEVLDHDLQAEADAEGGDAPADQRVERGGDVEVARRAGSR